MSRAGVIGVVVFWSVVAFCVATALWAPWLGVAAGLGFMALVASVMDYGVVTGIASMLAEDRLPSDYRSIPPPPWEEG